jgi:predicted butyrate kinase (DUF1464 family)
MLAKSEEGRVKIEALVEFILSQCRKRLRSVTHANFQISSQFKPIVQHKKCINLRLILKTSLDQKGWSRSVLKVDAVFESHVSERLVRPAGIESATRLTNWDCCK